MGDMAEFYGWGFVDYSPVEGLMALTNEKIYLQANKIVIPNNYEYKELCEKILKYYELHQTLSEKQKYALCRLILQYEE